MYNIVLYNHIQKKAKKRGLSVSYSNIKSKLHQFDLLECVRKNKIVFLVWKNGFSERMGASANVPFLIVFSAGWAVQLVVNDSDDTINAFRISLGHELAHKDGDFAVWYWERESKRFIRKEDRKFVNWVTEVHHDFSAAEKMANCSRKKLLSSIDYKITAKPDNKDGFSHPSWKKRKAYVEFINPDTGITGEFNEALINKIATDTDCYNTKLIERVWKYYKLIVLD